MGKFFQKTPGILQIFSDFLIEIPQMIWPRVAQGQLRTYFGFPIGKSDSVKSRLWKSNPKVWHMFRCPEDTCRDVSCAVSSVSPSVRAVPRALAKGCPSVRED